MRGTAIVAASLAVVFGSVGLAVAATFSVVSSDDEGPGTLRAAIVLANAEPRSTIVLDLSPDEQILLKTSLPALQARGTVVEGRGATLRQAAECQRPQGRRGCDGLVVRGAEITVRDLRIVGFLLDGVAVLGSGAKNVRIERLHAVDNMDDGVGVSGGAGPVLVTDCVLMGNGYRTKGKGLLVFSDASATLTNSVVVANRDGVTVTRGSKVTLEDVFVVGNYDKGVGASAGEVVARRTSVVANGQASQEGKAAPNGDGVRLGLRSSAKLSDCFISGNGDGGVVVLDSSRVRLLRCSIENNGGDATVVAPEATLTLESPR